MSFTECQETLGRVKGTERRRQQASSVTRGQTLGLHELQEAKGLWKLCTSPPTRTRTRTHAHTAPSGTGLQLSLSHNLYRPFLPDPPDLHPQSGSCTPHTCIFTRTCSQHPWEQAGVLQSECLRLSGVFDRHAPRPGAPAMHTGPANGQRAHIYRRNESCTVDEFMDVDVTWCSHLCLLGPFLPKGKVLQQQPLYPCTLRRAVGLPARGPVLVEASPQGC